MQTAKLKPIYLESTEISVERTAGEITALLVRAGARSLQMDYDESGKVIGMSFILLVNSLPQPFKLPVRIAGVRRQFEERRRKTAGFNAFKYKDADREQAERVAWRQLLRWVQVQMAMVDAEMVQAREVFAPYLVEPSGRTLFEYLEETRFKALPEPEAKGA